jgi:hypothetical protein
MMVCGRAGSAGCWIMVCGGIGIAICVEDPVSAAGADMLDRIIDLGALN